MIQGILDNLMAKRNAAKDAAAEPAAERQPAARAAPKAKEKAAAPAAKVGKTAEIRTWYADRYNTVLMQRNLMAVVTLACMAAVIVSVLVVMQITSIKEIDPFVIQVEDKSGMTNVIQPLDKDTLTTQKAMNDYFTVLYVKSRESYFAPTYEYDYKTVVRLLSADEVYRLFRREVNPANETSPVRWGAKGKRAVNIVSILQIGKPEDRTVQVRFTVADEKEHQPPETRTRTARLRYDFADMEMTTAERYINPVGFTVTEYNAADDYLNPEDKADKQEEE